MARSRGFTLIELLVAIVITALLLLVVVPNFADLLERRRVEGVANELSADLQYTRTEAVSRGQRVQFTTAGNGLSYRIDVLVATPILLKAVTLPNGITVSSGASLTYTGLRGVPDEAAGGDVVLNVASSKTAGQLRVVNNFMGRVQMCSPNGSLKGYTTC